MTFPRIFACVLAGLAVAFPALASEPDYVLEQIYRYSSQGLDSGSKGSGSGRTVLSERIIQEQDGRVEVEYSILGDLDEVRGNAKWMYPARVLVAPDGTKTLLNADELDARVNDWLKKAEWTREACGQWGFTWTAYQVLCDPQAVIGEIEAQDMRPGIIADGQAMQLPSFGTFVVLRKGEQDDRGLTYVGTAQIGSEFVRRQIAQSMVVTAQLNGDALSIEQALEQALSIEAEGEVTLTLIVDPQGLIVKRTEEYEMIVTGGEYGDERRTGTTTTFRVSYQDWILG